MRRSLLLLVVARGSSRLARSALDGAGAGAGGAAAAAAEVKPNDYSDDTSWLCRPGRKGDACDVDLTTTVVAADGTLTRETLARRSEGADRLLLRLSDGLDRRDAEQRHEPGPGGEERHPAAVRALRIEVPHVRADVPADHAPRPAGSARDQRRSAGAVQQGRSVRRRPRCVAALPEERQPGPRRGADRPLAGRVHPAGVDRERDRRQAGSEAAGRRVHPRRDVPHAEGQGRRRAVQADPALPQSPARSVASSITPRSARR